jgi:hypothetical protein
MKNLMVAATALVSTLALAGPASAGNALNTKITGVFQSGVRNNTVAGKYIELGISINSSFGSGCGSSNWAIYRIYLSHADREVQIRAFEGMRQVATSALLSGRNVDVFVDAAGCHNGFWYIENIGLK